MTKLIKPILLFSFLFFYTFAMAQPGNPGGDPDTIPIGGGIGFLVVAGIVLGVKKIYDRNKPGKGNG